MQVRSLDRGLCLLIELPPGSSDETEVITDAAERDLRLVSISRCWYDRPASARTMAIGFTATADHSFRTAADKLAYHTPPRAA